jgi:signal transduction histidine kinase/DNA-binding response OmpR family regulator
MSRRSEVLETTLFLEGGGELGELIRTYDWSKTPLGPPRRWPQSLRSAVSILLPSKAQIALFWGPELITLYNDAYRPVFGAKHPHALGMPIRDSWAELWRAGLRELFESVLQNGEAFWARDRPFFLERYGAPEETFFDVSYDPVRDESGNVGGVFCIVSETTGRVVGERRLKTLRDLAARYATARRAEEVCASSLEALADNPHDLPFALLFLSAAQGRPPVFAGGTEGTGTLGDANLWPWAEVLSDGELRIPALNASLGELPRGAWERPPEQVAVIPIRGTGQAGPAGLLVAGLNPFRPLDDDYRGFLDLVTKQVAAGLANAEAHEQERRRAESFAEIDRAKTVFFSNVSHEFRTPLALMLGPLEDALAQAERLPGDVRERLELAHRSSQRLLKLVNTLLDFARIEAGRAEASYELTELGSFTAELASVFRSTLESAGLRFVVDCPPLPDDAYVDRAMWEQIVFNLLSNAFKFTFEGWIEVTLRKEGSSAVLRIRDTGTGIPPDALPHLFERFYRVGGARGRTFEGSGIGLALVHELVRLHGGSIHVESEIDEGSLFVVTLPLGRAHLAPERIRAPRRLASTRLSAEVYIGDLLGWLPVSAEHAPEHATRRGVVPAGRRDGRQPGPRSRILLADDNADMRHYLGRLLGQDYDVVAVADGVAALREARERVPDLVLADVMMPELDGLGLVEALRADPRLAGLPIVLLSARSGEEARLEGMERGADDYLIKPFSSKELLARIGARLELSRLQRELQDERRFFVDLFAQMPVPTAVMRGPDLVFEMANRAYLEVAGRAQIVGQPFLEAFPELRDQGFDTLLHQVMHSGVPYVGREERLRLTRAGALVDTYWTFVYAPLRNPSGEVDAVIAICNEVTAEVGARERIRQSEARYRHIFDTAAVAIWEEDFSALKAALDQLRRAGVRDLPTYLHEHPEWVRQAVDLVRLVDVNEGAVRIFGARDKSELLESLTRVFTPETEAIFLEELVAIADGQRAFEAESAMRTLQGERIDVLFTLAVADDDPELRSVLVTAMDITARKQAERALHETDQRKDEFLAMLAHELRNPLAPLRNSLHLLRFLDDDSRSQAAALHEMMARQVEHLVRLVDDLLEMSRISRGTLELRKEPVALATIVRYAVETTQPHMASGGHRLDIVTPDEPLWVDGDPVRLAQVLANLLNNAAKYTDSGGTIALEVSREGSAAVVRVRDSGSGISPDALPRIFDMFSRGDRTSWRNKGGLGIGLALAKRLIEMHGGSIQAHSEGTGRGSEFTVRLPLVPGAQAAVTPPEDAAVPLLPQKRVLIVDDNRDAGEALGMLLECLGADVRVVFDGLTALGTYATYDPAVVLLDIGMPGMDGYDVARRIRSDFPERRSTLVALTGWGQEEHRRKTQASGFDHHLVKPADLDSLQALLVSLDDTAQPAPTPSSTSD